MIALCCWGLKVEFLQIKKMFFPLTLSTGDPAEDFIKESSGRNEGTPGSSGSARYGDSPKPPQPRKQAMLVGRLKPKKQKDRNRQLESCLQKRGCHKKVGMTWHQPVSNPK